MPDENGGEDIQGKPDRELIGTPSPPTDVDAAQNESTTVKLEQDIKRGEWWLIRIGVATVVINTVIGLIYYRQLREMQKVTSVATQSAVSTEEFFRADERAWVVIETTPYKTYPASGRFPARIMYGFYPKNIGKTIARNVHIHLDSATGADGKAAVLGPQSLAPGERAPASVITFGDVFLTTFSGRIDYVDAFRVSHWETFCYRVVDTSGVLEQCPTGNDEDDNPER